uniref:Ig-like domain-containing protein n=1 Tax=Crocodylus porosus TaxID=8502 RepID=A0A7M4FT87_CROPO
PAVPGDQQPPWYRLPGLSVLLWLLLVPPVPPALEPSESSEDLTATQGTAVTFTCEARGSPFPTLSWLKDGEPLSWQSNLVPSSQGTQLSLEAVQPKDSGVYSCVAVNEAGEASRHFHLSVMGACSGFPRGKQGEGGLRALGMADLGE